MSQPAYDEMLKTIPNIAFVEGVPGDLETLINFSIRNLVVIDDLMHELSNDQRMTNSFAKGCHHRNPSRRMPIVLGTFTSSSTKFVDLSYYAQSCRDAMKARQPWLPRMHDEAHQYVEGGKLNNECSTLLFSPFGSFVSQNREYAHISQ